MSCVGALMDGFWVFFPINTWTGFDLWLGVPGFRGPTEHTDYAILCRALELLWVLVSLGGLGANLLWTLGDNLSFGGVKSYTQISKCKGTSNTHVVHGSTVILIGT